MFTDTHEWIDSAVAQVLGNREEWATDSDPFADFDANFRAMEASAEVWLKPNYKTERATHTGEPDCYCRVCHWVGVKSA